MASKPFESIETEIAIEHVGTDKFLGDENESNATPTLVRETQVNETQVNETQVNETQVNETQVNETQVNKTLVNKTLVNKTLVNETLVNETLVNEGEVLVADEQDGPSGDIPDDNAMNGSSPKGLINEYNSAVSYISNLIDQLRDKPGVPKAVKNFAESLTEVDLDSRVTQVIQDHAGDGSRTILLADSQASESESTATLQFAETSAGAKRADAKQVATSTTNKTQVYPTVKKGQRRSMIHNLREAAHLATSASLELNDCAAFAYRAYYCAFLGCACSLFSIVLAIMSPPATTLGFVGSMATFSLALGLGLKYLISFRGFVNKSAQALKSRAKAIDPTMSIS